MPRSDDDEMARVITPFAFMFLLYMGTFGISMGLLTSVIEEKSSRVVEVLLAAGERELGTVEGVGE